MDVAFYHDESSNRLAAAYDPQSSPGSVDSISSTDAGPVGAIPPYERFGQDYSKTSALKVMNVQVHCGNQPFTSEQQVNYRTAEAITVSSENYRQLKSFDSPNLTSTGCSRVSNTDVVNSASGSAPDVINMLKITGPDFDQMMTQYSNHPGTQLAPQVYPRGLVHQQEVYVQNYARDLARQRSQGGSNPNIATQNHGATPPPSVITTTSNGNFEPNDAFYDVRQHHPDDPTNSGFGTLATVHYMGDHPQPGHPLIMPHHSLKDDIPQTVPVIPKQSISPIDMEEQEIIKTERKRMRNRLAASKCRKRKLERISRLEEKVSNLKQQNLELSTNANLLRQQVAELKTKVMSHVNSGCQLMTSQPQVSF